jgi:hypothetical protein
MQRGASAPEAAAVAVGAGAPPKRPQLFIPLMQDLSHEVSGGGCVGGARVRCLYSNGALFL